MIPNKVVAAEATFWQGPLDILLTTLSRDSGTVIVFLTILNSVSIVDLTSLHLPVDLVLAVPPTWTCSSALTNVCGYWSLAPPTPTLTVIVVPVTAVITGGVDDIGSDDLGYVWLVAPLSLVQLNTIDSVGIWTTSPSLWSWVPTVRVKSPVVWS